MFDQRGELPLLPFGNPIGIVPASRGGIYIELKGKPHAMRHCDDKVTYYSPTGS